MSSNGKRRPPRPSLEVVAPGAGPREAAAIAAALEQFLHDTAPAPTTSTTTTSAWERAALAEAVGLDCPSEWDRSPVWTF